MSERSRFPRLPADLPRLGTRETARRLFGVSTYQLYRWVADGKLRAYLVEGVATPRYDLDQIAQLLQSEKEGPAAGGVGRLTGALQSSIAPPRQDIGVNCLLAWLSQSIDPWTGTTWWGNGR